MDWWFALIIVVGVLLILFSLGIPVAFAFLLCNIMGVFLFWGGEPGLSQFVLATYESLTNFSFLPIMLFLFMGSILFYSGIALKAIDALETWIGRVPGRLSLLAIASGVLLGSTCGSAPASTAILGSGLGPEMERRGYSKQMSLGPIMAGGGLAMMFPPSSLAVLVAAMAQTSISAVLIGGIVPGLMLAVISIAYVILRCWLNPALTPTYVSEPVPFYTKVMLTIKHVLPLGLIVFMVTGIMLLGIATPTEAGAAGVVSSFVLVLCSRKLNWQRFKEIMVSTLKTTIMIYMVLTGAVVFGAIVAFSGATQGLASFLIGLPVPPILVVIILLAVLLILGTALDDVSIAMVIIPLFLPVIKAFGMDPVWFCVLLVLNIQIGIISPPFGSVLFVMQGVAAPGTTTRDIYRAIWPFFFLDLIVMAVLIAFPITVLWLPSLMH
jgi:tripartite ATP-independent transporter DctM subunit